MRRVTWSTEDSFESVAQYLKPHNQILGLYDENEVEIGNMFFLSIFMNG